MSFQRFLNGGEGIFHSPIGHLSDIVPKSFLQSFQQSRRNGLTQAIDCESIFGIGVFPKKNKKFANWKKKKKDEYFARSFFTWRLSLYLLYSSSSLSPGVSPIVQPFSRKLFGHVSILSSMTGSLLPDYEPRSSSLTSLRAAVQLKKNPEKREQSSLL